MRRRLRQLLLIALTLAALAVAGLWAVSYWWKLSMDCIAVPPLHAGIGARVICSRLRLSVVWYDELHWYLNSQQPHPILRTSHESVAQIQAMLAADRQRWKNRGIPAHTIAMMQEGSMNRPAFAWTRCRPIDDIGDESSLTFPPWLPMFVLSAWPVLAAVRGRRRDRSGCCRTCGYDLRGTPGGSCPECGADAGARSASACLGRARSVSE